MADKTIEIGLNAKLNVQTTGTEKLETLKARALAASDAIKSPPLETRCSNGF